MKIQSKNRRTWACVEIPLLFACALLYVVFGTASGLIEMNDGIDNGVFDYPQSQY